MTDVEAFRRNRPLSRPDDEPAAFLLAFGVIVLAVVGALFLQACLSLITIGSTP